MILFLNFAPLSFGGGVERWIISVADHLSTKEKVTVLQVDRSISDIYAKLILKRTFDSRLRVKPKAFQQSFVTWSSLIPFSKSGQLIRKQIRDARLIYTKLEVNEMLLLLYFGGISGLQKTIIGLHSTLRYAHTPLSLTESIHNFMYASIFTRSLISNARKIHILNSDQKNLLGLDYHLTNIVSIPNFVDNAFLFTPETSSNLLKICFVGELSTKKGADLLLSIIRESPEHFTYDVAGDGPLKTEFKDIRSKQIRYHGYVEQEKINSILSTSDVLLMPSRAESFSLVSLDALSLGLAVVTSPYIPRSEVSQYLVANPDSSAASYLKILVGLYSDKQQGVLKTRRNKVSKLVRLRFSKESIIKQLDTRLFQQGKQGN